MSCYHNPISIKAEIARSHSNFLGKRSGKMPHEELIQRCLSNMHSDNPNRQIASAKVVQCALREIVQQDRVQQNRTGLTGVTRLLNTLNQAISTFESSGETNGLRFVIMRISRELPRLLKPKPKAPTFASPQSRRYS